MIFFYHFSSHDNYPKYLATVEIKSSDRPCLDIQSLFHPMNDALVAYHMSGNPVTRLWG